MTGMKPPLKLRIATLVKSFREQTPPFCACPCHSDPTWGPVKNVLLDALTGAQPKEDQ